MRNDLIVAILGLAVLILLVGCATIPDKASEEAAEGVSDETEEPAEPTEQPEEPTEQPEEPAEQPEEPGEEPKEPAEEPEEPAEEEEAEDSTELSCDGGEYLPGKGFTWKTKDGNFGLRIGGRFQFHWLLDNYDIHRTTRLDNNAEFGIPRAYVFLSGHAYKEFKYTLSYRIDKGLFDDWAITYTPKELQKKIADMSLDITAGHFKPRFSREFLTSSGGLSLVNRNLADAEFRLNRDYGVNVTGTLLEKKLRIDLGAFNGLADSSSDNTGFRLTVRAQFDLNAPPATQGDLKKTEKPAFSVGLAYSLENDVYDFDGNGIYDDNGTRLTFDWTFYWMGVNVLGAYFARTEQNQKTAGPGDPNEKNRNAAGYSLQGSYFVLPGKLELIAAMSYIEPDVKDPRARRGNSSGWKHESRFGVGYYLKGHSLKIQADYGNIRDRQTHGSLDDQQVRLQLTLGF